jgi:hypothetical protein
MITTEKFDELQDLVRNSKMSSEFDNAEQVAIVAAPAVIIEVIVKKASLTSGIPMDWCYFGGRGIVYALGDVEKAKKELRYCIPMHNLDS